MGRLDVRVNELMTSLRTRVLAMIIIIGVKDESDILNEERGLGCAVIVDARVGCLS